MAETKGSTANGEAQRAPVQVKRKVVTRACGYPRRSRSVRLIEGLLSTGRVDGDDLASALGVTSRALESYRRGRARMPLERQLRLAQLVIERWPYTRQLRRNGFGLRSQVLAEVAFHARITKTHMAPMVTPWVWLR
jgi:hypothetical protein